MKGFYPRLQINITFGAIKQASTKMGTKKNTAEKKEDQNTPTLTHTQTDAQKHSVFTVCVCHGLKSAFGFPPNLTSLP